MHSFVLQFFPTADKYFEDGDDPSEQGRLVAGQYLLDGVGELKLHEYLTVYLKRLPTLRI